MDLIDSKYIGLISSRLEKFKKVKIDLYNFRCPICGDSKKSRNKTRGYFYVVKNNTNFKCHNCGSSLSFNNFLKEIDPLLYKQYSLEKFKSGFTGKNFVTEEPKLEFKKPVFRKKIDLPKASENESAKRYLLGRKLDPEKFYFADKFKEWTNTLKDTFSSINKEESRIIIPLYGFEKELVGFQGRSLGPNSVKYITVMLSDDAPKIYGLDTIDPQKRIYIVEGPFDSTFVHNSIAMCGSDLDIKNFGWNDYVYVFDNEPRNQEIVNKMEKIIDRGNNIIIWPKIVQQKDINDMILAGHNVMDVLKSNTHSGLEAKVKFTEWKKV